jgi:catechol 2,3-dioxygenase-like lactoylglutathione lyase family enzyme
VTITGVHILFYSKDAEADRAFLRDTIGLRAIDIGHGWMIFALPPAEAAVHPAEPEDGGSRDHAMLTAHVYLMCDDVEAAVADLAKKGVRCKPIDRQRWGIHTAIPLPSGGEIGLYQPLHPTAI